MRRSSKEPARHAHILNLRTCPWRRLLYLVKKAERPKCLAEGSVEVAVRRRGLDGRKDFLKSQIPVQEIISAALARGLVNEQNAVA